MCECGSDFIECGSGIFKSLWSPKEQSLKGVLKETDLCAVEG